MSILHESPVGCSARVQLFAVLADGRVVSDEGFGKMLLDVVVPAEVVPEGEHPVVPPERTHALREQLTAELRDWDDEDDRWASLLAALCAQGLPADSPALDRAPFRVVWGRPPS